MNESLAPVGEQRITAANVLAVRKDDSGSGLPEVTSGRVVRKGMAGKRALAWRDVRRPSMDAAKSSTKFRSWTPMFCYWTCASPPDGLSALQACIQPNKSVRRVDRY